MIGKFWESVGGKLADRWAGAAGPALVFWAGGLLAWLLAHGGWHRLSDLGTWLQRQSAAGQIATLLALLLGVATSSVVVGWAVEGTLRLIEGYLPRPAAFLRPLLLRWTRRSAGRVLTELQELAEEVAEGRATPEQRARFQNLDRRRDWPSWPDRYMPTRVGNILRAGESRPVDKYGLDPLAVWPHMWLLLPDQARADLIAARTALDGAVAGFLWGLLFSAFTVWTPWALPVSLAVVTSTCLFLLPARARTFADLVEAAIDLYRTDLYEQLRWPLPTDPAAERVSGRLLTKYLGADSTPRPRPSRPRAPPERPRRRALAVLPSTNSSSARPAPHADAVAVRGALVGVEPGTDHGVDAVGPAGAKGAAEREAGHLIGSRQCPLPAVRMQQVGERDGNVAVARHLDRLAAGTSWQEATGTFVVGRLVDATLISLPTPPGTQAAARPDPSGCWVCAPPAARRRTA
ncbi:hypothetical protein [Streptomyces yangpuensis]|uniref:hypothetical protein n=1 Tax=Streptomyces yangpuensis TaxID=1648182 RepID=UPI003686E97A